MPRASCLMLGFFTLFLLATPGLAQSRRESEENVIRWPSPTHPDLQSAINAAPNGSTIKIAQGTFDITEPLTIAGKRITIKGAGSGKKHDGDEKSLTHLRGPRRLGVVDSRLGAALFNYVGGGGRLQGLKLSGFDVVITGRDDDGGRAEPLEVRNTVITESGRGIVWRAQAEVDLFKVEMSKMKSIAFMLLNGKLSAFDIVITEIEDIGIYIHTPGACAPEQNTIKKAQVVFCEGPGIMVYQCCAVIEQSQVGFCGGGGIWAIQSAVEVLNCSLELNVKVGIGAVEALIGIVGNVIDLTIPHLDHPNFLGDGVALVADLVPTIAFVFDNHITDSARAGLSNWGSEVTLGGNTIECSAFDLNAEVWKGLAPVFVEFPGNKCGCGVGLGNCIATSSGLAPPEPAVPIE